MRDVDRSIRLMLSSSRSSRRAYAVRVGLEVLVTRWVAGGGI